MALALPRPRYPLSWLTPHVHTWMDPGVPPAERRPVAETLGLGPTRMQPGRVYKCSECGAEYEAPPRYQRYLR